MVILKSYCFKETMQTLLHVYFCMCIKSTIISNRRSKGTSIFTFLMSYEQGLSLLYTGNVHWCSDPSQHIHQSRIANSSRFMLVDMSTLTASEWLVLCCAFFNFVK
jgi:hypothetical protein